MLSCARSTIVLGTDCSSRRVARTGDRVREFARARAAEQRAASDAAKRAPAAPTAEVEADRLWLLERLRAAGAAPPTGPELASERGHAVLAALRLLEREGAIVAVERDRWYEAGVLKGVLRLIAGALAAGAERTPAELREVLGVSRKYLVPLLEFCDRQGYTIRSETGRMAGPALQRVETIL